MVPPLANTTIHIWDIPIHTDNYRIAQSFVKCLSEEEQARVRQFKVVAAQKTFLIAHTALRLLSSYYTGVEPSQIKFVANAYGKPRLANKHAPYFNLSHSHQKAVIAFSRHEVGVDIEYSYRKVSCQEVAALVFSKQEQASLANLSYEEEQKQFLTLWTKKEALLKGIGVGIAHSCHQVDLSARDTWVTATDSVWQIAPFDTFAMNYCGHIAYLSRSTIQPAYYTWVFPLMGTSY